MDRYAEIALKYWPLWTLAAIIVCICYVSGLFHYPGLELMTVLGFGDYVSLSLPAIPIILFGILGIVAMQGDPERAATERRQRIDELERKELEKSPEQRRWNKYPTRKYERYATLITPVIASFYLSLSNSLPPHLAFVSFLYLVGALAVLGITFMTWAIYRNIDVGVFAIIAFLFCGAAYSSGLFASSVNYWTSRDAAIYFQDGTVTCANVVMLTQHGPIFTEDRRTTRIANWANVSVIAEVPGCVVRTSSPETVE